MGTWTGLWEGFHGGRERKAWKLVAGRKMGCRQEVEWTEDLELAQEFPSAHPRKGWLYRLLPDISRKKGAVIR